MFTANFPTGHYFLDSECSREESWQRNRVVRVLNFSTALGIDRDEATEPNPVDGTRSVTKTHQYSSKYCRNRNLCAHYSGGHDERSC